MSNTYFSTNGIQPGRSAIWEISCGRLCLACLPCVCDRTGGDRVLCALGRGLAASQMYACTDPSIGTYIYLVLSVYRHWLPPGRETRPGLGSDELCCCLLMYMVQKFVVLPQMFLDWAVLDKRQRQGTRALQVSILAVFVCFSHGCGWFDLFPPPPNYLK
jgi:hypothetical protein